MLKFWAALLTWVSLFALVPTAGAQETNVDVRPVRPGEVRFDVEKTEGQSSAERQPRRARPWRAGPRTPPPPRIVYAEVRTNPLTGERCAYLYMGPGDPESSVAVNAEQTAIRLASEYGICPNSPRQANGAVTPAAAAEMFWQDSVELPDPVLEIKPGYAITGKAVYLEINSPRSVTEETTAFGHSVQLNVTSVLDIEWGDGSVERNVTRPGGPWPSGDITHVYTSTNGATPLKVTQRWHATWRVGSLTGAITDQLFTESTMNLDVRQLQAVRDR
jgi:hypothetical protein